MPNPWKNASKRKTGDSIRALVPTGTLKCLIDHAKKQCVLHRAQLDEIEGKDKPHPMCERCKLRRHLEIADRISKKMMKRSLLAFERREERRQLEKQGKFTPSDLYGESPSTVVEHGTDRPTRW